MGSGANVFLGNVTNNTTVNSLKLVTLGDASINGNLFINKDLNVTGNLSVNQYQTKQTITTLNYQLQVVEDLSINGRLFLNGNASVTGLTTTGSVGIGIANPTSTLHVAGNAAITGALALTGGLTTTGNVGIGIANPTSTLHVAGNAAITGALALTGGLTTTGNVGIGLTNPTSTLHVAGNAAITGDVSFGSRLNFPPLVGYVAGSTVSPNSTAATSSTWVNNGITWTCSSSSFYTNETPNRNDYLAFNNNTNPAWMNWLQSFANANYTGGSVGNKTYVGVKYTTSITGISSSYVYTPDGNVNIAGEWLQIQSSIPVVMKDINIVSGDFVAVNTPVAFIIVGSNDGITWNPITRYVVASSPANSAESVAMGTMLVYTTSPGSVTTGSTTFTPTGYSYATNAYTYFRMVVTSVYNSTAVSLNEWNINFTPAAITLAPSTTTYGQLNLTGGLTTTGNVGIGSRLNFPPLVVSPNSTAATSSTWANNGITWTSSASSIFPYDAPTSEKAFDTNSSTFWHSNTTCYVSGVANSTISTSINSGGTVSSVNGEWMQIQSSVPVIMKDFKLTERGSVHFIRMPKTFYIVGSNNGSTWTTIMYGTTTSTTGGASGTVPVSTLTSSGTGTIANFYGSTSLSYTTYGNVTTPFAYFRIITSHLIGTAETNINIAEWNINFTPAAITLAPSTTTYGQLDLTGGLTTTGNVGIGTNNPQADFHIAGGKNFRFGGYNSYAWFGGNYSNTSLLPNIYLNVPDSGNRYVMTFGLGGYGAGYGAGGATSQYGAIMCTGGSTQYSTTSDYRLKENIIDLSNAVQKVLRLKPRYFNFKGIDKTTCGFIAHEVQEIIPEAVIGEKDAVHANGNVDSQLLEQSRIIPYLVGAVQEQQSQIDALVARLAAAGIA